MAGLQWTRGLGMVLRTGVAPLVLGMRWRNGYGDHGDRSIPPPEPGWRTHSRRALDEFFLATELVTAPMVSARERERLGAELYSAVELYDQRGWIEDPASYHLTPPPAESVVREGAKMALGSFDHLRFESGYAPHEGEPGRERWLGYEGNRTAHAWLLEHPGRPRPWLVCVPGYRMGHPLVDFTGFRARWLHQQLGLNVAIPVLPLHGPRAEGARGGDGFLRGDFVDTVHAQAQAVWDIRRLIGWLRTERSAPRVGAHGVSLGGYTTGLLVGLEPDLDCAIAGAPAADFVRLMRRHMPPVAIRMASVVGFPFDTLERLLRVVSPLALPPQLPKERRYVYAGKADSLVTPDHAHDLWRHWDEPHISWYEGGHVSFIWNREVRELVTHALTASGLVEGPLLA